MTPGEALTVWDFALVAVACAGAAGYAWLLPRWQRPTPLAGLCDDLADAGRVVVRVLYTVAVAFVTVIATLAVAP